MRVQVAVLAAAMLVGTGVQSSSQMIFGEGTETCGTWILERPPGRRPTRDGVAFLSWVLGYLSASNVSQSSGLDFLKQTNSAGILAWMDRYCQENPLDRIYLATQNLQQELVSRARHK
jgi:hypothetical protein